MLACINLFTSVYRHLRGFRFGVLLTTFLGMEVHLHFVKKARSGMVLGLP